MAGLTHLYFCHPGRTLRLRQCCLEHVFRTDVEDVCIVPITVIDEIVFVYCDGDNAVPDQLDFFSIIYDTEMSCCLFRRIFRPDLAKAFKTSVFDIISGRDRRCNRCGICCHEIVYRVTVVGYRKLVPFLIRSADDDCLADTAGDKVFRIGVFVAGGADHNDPFIDRLFDRFFHDGTVLGCVSADGKVDDLYILAPCILNRRVYRGHIADAVIADRFDGQDLRILVLAPDRVDHLLAVSIHVDAVISQHGDHVACIARGSTGIDDSHVVCLDTVLQGFFQGVKRCFAFCHLRSRLSVSLAFRDADRLIDLDEVCFFFQADISELCILFRLELQEVHILE